MKSLIKQTKENLSFMAYEWSKAFSRISEKKTSFSKKQHSVLNSF